MENIDNFLDAPTLNISKYESFLGNPLEISSADLGALLGYKDQGFVEYVMASVFPGLTDRAQFGPMYAAHIDAQEARWILASARENLQYMDMENIRGRTVVFRDDNPFLAGANQYGKLIMELANGGEIQYVDKEEALYDIYAAGTALKALYLKHIGPSVGAYLNNPAFQACENYYDIYAAVKTMDPTLTFDILPKDRFISQYRSDARLQWVADEFQIDPMRENIGFLQRVYLSIESELNAKYLTKALTDNFRAFVADIVAGFPPEYKKMYAPQMEAMFSGDTRLMLQAARRFANLRAGNLSEKLSDNLSDTLVREIVNVDFVPEKIVINNKAAVIYLARDISIPSLQYLGFDSPATNIGATAFRNMLGELGVMATSSNYASLRLEFNVASRGHFRNLFSSIVLAAILPLKDREALKDREEFRDRTIVFSDPAVFLGGQDNFVGKAIELMVNTPPEILSPGIPDYNPDTSPQPYYYNPQSPPGFRAQKANILLRTGTGTKFEKSMNVDYIDKAHEYFSIRPQNIDARIAHWVQLRFDMFVTFYVYLHTQFVAPARFDLELFYRDVYSHFVNKMVPGDQRDALKAIVASFNPNNEISKMFVELIVSNLSVVLSSGEVDGEKFAAFQQKGIAELNRMRDIDKPNATLSDRLALCEERVDNKLAAYFNMGDIFVQTHFSQTVMLLIFSKYQFHTQNSYTDHESDLINFWWSV